MAILKEEDDMSEEIISKDDKEQTIDDDISKWNEILKDTWKHLKKNSEHRPTTLSVTKWGRENNENIELRAIIGFYNSNNGYISIVPYGHFDTEGGFTITNEEEFEKSFTPTGLKLTDKEALKFDMNSEELSKAFCASTWLYYKEEDE